jgi:DNA-binding MarR family transcriptional regulator
MHDDVIMPFRPADEILPLTPLSFEILLALLGGERHGYAILQALEGRVSATLPMRTGTLYRALSRLLDEGLIEKARTGEDDERYARFIPRRYDLNGRIWNVFSMSALVKTPGFVQAAS